MITKELLCSSFVLFHSDLLNLSCFKGVKYEGCVLDLRCILLFKPKNKFDLFKIRKLLKFEKNYFNIKIKEGYYCITLNIPYKYKNVIYTIINTNYDDTTCNLIARYNALQQKTLAAHKSSQGLFFYNP